MLHRIYKRPEVANKEMGNCGNINKGNGRSYGLASWGVIGGIIHPRVGQALR